MNNSSAPLPSKSIRKSRRWFSSLLLLLLFVISGLGYYAWQQLLNVQWQVERDLKPLKEAVAKLQTTLQSLQGQGIEQSHLVSTLQSRVTALVDQQKQVDGNIDALIREFQTPKPMDNPDWVLSEIVYLITIAQQRLVLLQEPEGALSALVAADERLKRLHNPALLPLRTELTNSIQGLRDLKRPDLAGLMLQLSQYAAQVENLPLQQGTRPDDAGVIEQKPSQPISVLPQNEGLLSAIWHQITGLIVVRYNAEAPTGLLNKEQRYFIAQYVRLTLEMARFAILYRDDVQFKGTLTTTLSWLKRYYDQDDSVVKEWQVNLARLQEVTLNPTLPKLDKLVDTAQRLLGTLPSTLPPIETTQP